MLSFSLSAFFYALNESILDISGKPNFSIEKVSLFTFGFTFYSLVGFLVWLLLSAFNILPWFNKDNLHYGIITGIFLWILIIFFYFLSKPRALNHNIIESKCKLVGAVSGIFWGSIAGLIFGAIYADSFNEFFLIFFAGAMAGFSVGMYMGYLFNDIPAFNKKFNAHIYVLIGIGISNLFWILLSVILVMFLL